MRRNRFSCLNPWAFRTSTNVPRVFWRFVLSTMIINLLFYFSLEVIVRGWVKYPNDRVLTYQLWDRTEFAPSKVIPSYSRRLHCLGRSQPRGLQKFLSTLANLQISHPVWFFYIAFIWHTKRLQASSFASQIIIAIRPVFNEVTPTSTEWDCFYYIIMIINN